MHRHHWHFASVQHAEEKHKRTLGFAIERAEGRSKKFEDLETTMVFPGQEHVPGESHSSKLSPVQKFRWSDYRVYPNTSYRYRAYPVYGTPEEPELDDPVELSVRTASESSWYPQGSL